MAEAVDLARLHGVARLDWALGHAATFGRFAEGDLASILSANQHGIVVLVKATRCSVGPAPGKASADDRPVTGR